MSDIKPSKWTITKAGGVWWAECPDDYVGPDGYCACLCESFDTHAEALAHIAKHATEALDS